MRASAPAWAKSIDITLHDSALHFLANIASDYLNTGDNPTRFGNALASIVPYQLLDTADGCIALAVGNNQQYRRLCGEVLGCPELWSDKRFRINAARTRNREILVPRLRAEFARHPTQAEAFGSQEAQAREVVMAAARPQLGQVRMVRSPLRPSGSPTVAPTAPPGLGEHTRDVLSGVLSYSAARIAELERQGAVVCADASAAAASSP